MSTPKVVDHPTATGSALDAADERALQRVRPPVQDDELQGLLEFGEIVARSGFFTDAKATAQAVVKLAIGRELGLSKTAALTQIYIFEAKGRTNVIIGAHLIAAKINASAGYRVRILETTPELCAILPHKRGGEFGGGKDATEGEFAPVGAPCRGADGKGCKGKACAPCYGFGVVPVTFTLKDAARAGLSGKDNWKGDPEAMLYARCLARTQRRYFADLFTIGAVYVPEEFDEVRVTRVEAEPEVTVQRPRRASEAPPVDAIDVEPVAPAPAEWQCTGCGDHLADSVSACPRCGPAYGPAVPTEPKPPASSAPSAEDLEYCQGGDSFNQACDTCHAKRASDVAFGRAVPAEGGPKRCKNPKHPGFSGLFCPACLEGK